VLLLTEGQVSDYKGAATMLPAMPTAPVLIADRGYDADCSARRSAPAAQNPASPVVLAARTLYATASSSTALATRSRSCSAG